MTNIFNNWEQYIDAFTTIYIDNNHNNLYELYPNYYDEIINKKSNIDYYIIEHFLKINTNNLLKNLLVYNNSFPLYYYHQYNLTNSNSNLLSYENIINNYYNSYQKIYNILYKCRIYNQNLDNNSQIITTTPLKSALNMNILYNSIPFIYNYNIINDFNNELFYEDITKCKIIAFYIDILIKHYIIDISIFKDIPAISYNNLNNRYLYINKSFSYIILSNIKFYSNYLQNIDNISNVKRLNMGIIGGSLIFNNWDDFYYMFNYNKNGCDLDYDIIKNNTNEFYLSFYNIIKYILQDNYKNNYKNKNEFQTFVQEGFDKFIYNVCHYTDTMILHGDIVNLDYDDLYINYTNIIKLFKLYNNSLRPNLDPLFEKVYNNVDDNSLSNTINDLDNYLADYLDDNLNNDTLIDDFYINENLTIYQQRGVLLDCIISVFIKDSKKSEYLNQNELLNIVNEPYDIIDILDIIEDYYVYNIYTDLLKYENWVDIEAKKNPNINTTYKKLRYMRLKYYSTNLKQLYKNPNDEY